MALSSEWTEWHLTPDGWVEGSSQIDPGRIISVDPPNNRLLTVKIEEEIPNIVPGEQGFNNFNVEKDVREIWRASGQDIQIEELLTQYGRKTAI